MRRMVGAALVAMVLAAGQQAMAAGEAVRVRGMVAAVSGNVATVRTLAGETVEVRLADNFRVSLARPIGIEEIRQNSYVGIASMPGKDGRFVALEVSVFPEDARGRGEGSYPWDLQPGCQMTNGTVAKLARKPKGRELQVTYQGKTQTIVVPKEAAIVTFGPGDKSLVRSGAQAVLFTTRQADNSLLAANIVVGKDGIQPPM